MRHYETIFIINPELSDDDITAVVEKFRDILTDGGATMVKIDDWGRRRMAYEVKKFHKGYFVLFEYGAQPAPVAEMERNFKIDERVIRYLTILLGDSFDAEALLPPEQEEEKASEEEAAEAPAEAETEEKEAPAAEEAAEEAEEAPKTDDEQEQE